MGKLMIKRVSVLLCFVSIVFFLGIDTAMAQAEEADSKVSGTLIKDSSQEISDLSQNNGLSQKLPQTGEEIGGQLTLLGVSFVFICLMINWKERRGLDENL